MREQARSPAPQASAPWAAPLPSGFCGLAPAWICPPSSRTHAPGRDWYPAAVHCVGTSHTQGLPPPALGLGGRPPAAGQWAGGAGEPSQRWLSPVTPCLCSGDPTDLERLLHRAVVSTVPLALAWTHMSPRHSTRQSTHPPRTRWGLLPPTGRRLPHLLGASGWRAAGRMA